VVADSRLTRPGGLDTVPKLATNSTRVFKEQATMIRKVLLVLALLGMALAATSCNTIQGAGRDIAAAGEAISEAATNP
jgi:predicted small secreted protein